jgi:hypothetical protein
MLMYGHTHISHMHIFIMYNAYACLYIYYLCLSVCVCVCLCLLAPSDDLLQHLSVAGEVALIRLMRHPDGSSKG